MFIVFKIAYSKNHSKAQFRWYKKSFSYSMEMLYCKLYTGLMTAILINDEYGVMNFLNLFGIKYSFPPSVLTAINQPITKSEYSPYECKRSIQLSSSVGREVL